MSLYRSKPIKKTLSPHVCHGCGDRIQPGSKALYIVSSDDGATGQLFTGYLCHICDTIWNNCKKARDEYPDGFGEEDIKDTCEACEARERCEILEGKP